MAPFCTTTLFEATNGPIVCSQPTGCGNQVMVVGGASAFGAFSKKTTWISDDGTLLAGPDRTATAFGGVLATEGEYYDNSFTYDGTPSIGACRLANGDTVTVGYHALSHNIGAARNIALTGDWQDMPPLESGSTYGGTPVFEVHALPNGQVLVIPYDGGIYTGGTYYGWIWSPGTNTWARLAMPVALSASNLAGSALQLTSCQLTDGRVMVVGRNVLGGINVTSYPFCWAIYDASTGWVAAPATYTIAAAAPGFPAAGKRLQSEWGGVVELDAGRAVLVLAIATNSGSQHLQRTLSLMFDGAAWAAAGDLNTRRTDFALAGSCGGEAFVAGGDKGTLNAIDLTNSIEQFDASTGLWTAFDTLPSPRMSAKAIVMKSQDSVAPSRLWVIGGDTTGHSVYTDEAVSYRGTYVCPCTCGGASETTPPVVTNFTPSNHLLAARRDPIGFDVTDDVALRRSFVLLEMGGRIEPVHDGTDFLPGYTGTLTPITGGNTYSVKRGGGFPRGTITVRVYPIDTSGNEP